jgi:hypothetical protein
MKKLLVFVLILASVALVEVAAQGYSFGMGLKTIVPVSSNRFIDDVQGGLHFRYRPGDSFGIFLDYVYVGKEYYYFDHNRKTWRGAVPWSQVPDDIEEGEWLFYHTRHYIAPYPVFFIPAGRIDFLIGAGPSFVFLVSPLRETYYPAFQSAFEEIKSRNEVFIGYTLHLGAEVHLWRWLTLGAEYLLESDRIVDFADKFREHGIDYLHKEGNLILSMNFVFGTRNSRGGGYEEW